MTSPTVINLRGSPLVAELHCYGQPDSSLRFRFNQCDSRLRCEYRRAEDLYRGEMVAGCIEALGRLYISANMRVLGPSGSAIVVFSGSWNIVDDGATDGSGWLQAMVLRGESSMAEKFVQIRDHEVLRAASPSFGLARSA